MRGEGLKMRWHAQEGRIQKLVVVSGGRREEAGGGVGDKWP